MSNVISVFRSENKYILSKEDTCNLKFKLDKILSKDNNVINDKYIVRSLYFDSLNNIDFSTKIAGDEIRKKIRIRVYDINSNKCKLEMKQKFGDMQHKISMWISKNDALELIKKNYNVLLKYFEKDDDAILFYKTMVLGCYSPIVLIEYDRIAYTYPINNTRITFDMNIKSSESNFNLFDKNPIYTPILYKENILEVKYNEKLMSFISNIFKPYKLNKISVSKYCHSRKIFYDFDF